MIVLITKCDSIELICYALEIEDDVGHVDLYLCFLEAQVAASSKSVPMFSVSVHLFNLFSSACTIVVVDTVGNLDPRFFVSIFFVDPGLFEDDGISYSLCLQVLMIVSVIIPFVSRSYHHFFRSWCELLSCFFVVHDFWLPETFVLFSFKKWW